MQKNNVYKKKVRFKDLSKEIKWLCYDVLISVDKLIVYHNFSVCKTKLINTTMYYFINNDWRNKDWINENCTNVLGFVEF